MSLHFNCVIHCEFPGDLRREYAEILRLVTTPAYELDFKPEFGDPFLDSIMGMVQAGYHLRPESEGLHLSRFDTRLNSDGSIDCHVLQYTGHEIHDDFFYDLHLSLIEWIAGLCREGLIGYFCESIEQYAYPVNLFQAREGKLIVIRLNADGSVSEDW